MSLIGEVGKAPVASVRDVKRVVAILSQDTQLDAAQIAAKMGMKPNENSRRRVRSIARAGRPGIVSWPNSTGYKLFENCTVEEIRACVNHWRSVEKDASLTAQLFQDKLYSTFGAGA